MTRLALATIVLSLLPSICSADQVADITQRTRQAAIDRWHPDAQLVEIQVAGMRGAAGQIENGGLTYFFISPSSSGLLDVRTLFNVSPQAQALIERGQPEYTGTLETLQWSEEPQAQGFPYRLAIPENIIDLDKALTMVHLGPVVSAEIHVYKLKSGGSFPAWYIEPAPGERPVYIDALHGTILGCQPIREPTGFKVFLGC